MVTTVTKKKAAIDPVATFQEHILLKHQAAKIVSRIDALKKRLKDGFTGFSNVYKNENGSLFYDLPATITVEGVDYAGMELRRNVSTKFNEETAEKILERKGVLKEAQSTLVYIDQDKVSRLQQEGKITEKDIDKMFDEDESWAFWPVKGAVI